MPKVSIIIPVYNTKNYLEKCLNSVINQTLEDIEIICINGGSTDGSSIILNKFSKKDHRIKLIDLPQNQGVSAARNKGIDTATGEYIGFIDSDDFVDLDFFEKLYFKAKEKNADAAKGNIYDYNEQKNTFKLTPFYNMNDKIRKNHAYFYYGFTSAIYRRDFINKFNIRFPENINYFEDPYFSIKAAINYKTVEFDDSAKYYYVRRNNSLSANPLEKNNRNAFKQIFINILNIINSDEVSGEIRSIVSDFLLSISNNIYNSEFDKEIKNYILDFYKQYDYLNKNKNLVKILVSYIKPSFLFKSEILTPIHLGRTVERESSKDGSVTEDEIKWLHENCIGDDDFDGNISNLNRRVGFFTGTYWAWKNYQKLGNPEYFGSFGYRRLLFPAFLNNIEQYDLILPDKKYFDEMLKTQIVNCHGQTLYDAMIDSVKNIYPNELKKVTEYFNGYSGYYAEIYIMKQKFFFDYCEWIYKLIEYLIQKYPTLIDTKTFAFFEHEDLLKNFVGSDIINKNTKKDIRDIAFIVERLTGYYLDKMANLKNIKYKSVQVIEPIYKPSTSYKQLVLQKMRQNIQNSIRK